MPIVRGLVLLTLCTAMACNTGNRSPAGRAGPDVESAVADLLSDYAGPAQPGACLLVRQEGAALFERCFGMADLERGRPADPETNFRLASLTKQFTAMAVVLLVEDGSLRFDTRVTDIFLGFPDYGKAIEIRHLLTHTSGLIDYESLLPESQTEQVKDADVLRLMMEQDSTYFTPGSEFRYSNSGYAVLAMVVEQASGERFAEFLAGHIFAPLGMTHTVAHEEGVSTVRNRAYGYSRTDEGWELSDQSVTSAVLGDGGIYTSIRDFGHWLDVVEGRRGGLVDPEMLERVFEPATPSQREGEYYGLGWFLDEYRGRRRYYHSGSTRGFRNGVERFPDEDLTVLFLSNRNEGDIARVDTIADIFLDTLSSVTERE